MDIIRRLPSPLEIQQRYPLNKEYEKLKRVFDKEFKDILSGKSDKFILVIGPCSADREDAVLDYCSRLSSIQERLEKLFIIPRVYTSKPRTIGDGYKGLLHQPYPNKEEDILAGLISVRRIHKKVIENTGLFPADELLYPEIMRYIGDLLGYVVIGARSVEDQQHRLISSGLDIPVGMKNPINGSIDTMMNSIITAQHPHHYIFNECEVISSGNPFAHGILRGGINNLGENISNYERESLIESIRRYSDKDLENKALIIDCNHSNSNKDYLKQITIANDVLQSRLEEPDIWNYVRGLMIESYLEDGRQSISGHVYGQSITDACLGWEKTEKLIFNLEEMLNK